MAVADDPQQFCLRVQTTMSEKRLHRVVCSSRLLQVLDQVLLRRGMVQNCRIEVPVDPL